MVATDQRLVGRCAVEEGYARLSCQWHVQVEPERPFRMQEADRRVDYDVAGEEIVFHAGTDMHRHVAWRVTGGVEGGHARRPRRSDLHRHVAWRVTGGVEGGHARRTAVLVLDCARARAAEFPIPLGSQR